MNKPNTKRIALTGVFCAFAYVAVVVCRIPVVMFLKYEPKDVIITLSGLILGPFTAFLVSVITSLVEMVTISDTGVIGLFMNVLASCAFACTASYIYKKLHSVEGAVIGLISGTAAMTVAMLLWNYIVTPFYMGVSRSDIAGMLVPMFLPFNLIKGGINAAITYLLYKPVTLALRRAGVIPKSNGGKGKVNAAFIVVAVVVLITCILAVLSFKKII